MVDKKIYRLWPRLMKIFHGDDPGLFQDLHDDNHILEFSKHFYYCMCPRGLTDNGLS